MPYRLERKKSLLFVDGVHNCLCKKFERINPKLLELTNKQLIISQVAAYKFNM